MNKPFQNLIPSEGKYKAWFQRTKDSYGKDFNGEFRPGMMFMYKQFHFVLHKTQFFHQGKLDCIHSTVIGPTATFDTALKIGIINKALYIGSTS